jgi:hypothetical protein
MRGEPGRAQTRPIASTYHSDVSSVIGTTIFIASSTRPTAAASASSSRIAPAPFESNGRLESRDGAAARR